MKTKFPYIKKEPIDTLQINIGYKCNQACKHCHVNSSPSRTEMMSEEVLNLIPMIIKKFNIKTLDITGGAPEMNPNFKKLILSLKNQNINIIDRCNLTIFFEKGNEAVIITLFSARKLGRYSYPFSKKIVKLHLSIIFIF